MLFVRQATTPGMRAARFPVPGERADPASLAAAAALAGVVAGLPAFAAPSAAAGQTASALGLDASAVPCLAEADAGRWAGLTYEQVARDEPDDLARWLADPHAAPHGGESLAGLADRVASWLGSGPPEEAVVVCDAGAIRAALACALGLDPWAAARFDVAPLSTTELSPARGGWRVAHVNRTVGRPVGRTPPRRPNRKVTA
ncbi:histidine phosphatase family protein [Nonomuraea pusilla]|uniref:Broad specificity phosphatase PhoE n=1 Tax=Nonomuraea pusilla TaxID=46177 RepID=A0A1H8EMI0_9ACTN|nr:histidine phosphatase family protein [Nonomuraea pusilla]SEN19998.1 Broad specificity phosphatase PhoE [Nonomuraea pusilla]